LPRNKSARRFYKSQSGSSLFRPGCASPGQPFCQGAEKSYTALEPVRPYLHVEASSLSREHRLKLDETFDATLSRFGAHTRRNLRYYRRRVEKELNASFHPELGQEKSQEALQHLKNGCFQPFPDSVANWWKMDGLLRTCPGYFAMGLRANGGWISYLVGIRTAKLTYVLVQVNHDGFSRSSFHCDALLFL
jgi:hypothetical protein